MWPARRQPRRPGRSRHPRQCQDAPGREQVGLEKIDLASIFCGILGLAGVLWEMKTMTERNILLAGILLLAGGAALADPPQPQGALPGEAKVDAIITIQNGDIRAGFWGPNQPATLGNVVAVLRQIYPEVNIVVEPGLNQIKIGDAVVHGMEPDLDLEAFSAASGGQFVCEQHASSFAPGPFPGLLIVKTNQMPPKPEIRIESFNLSGYIATKTQSTNEQDRRKVIDESLDKLQNIIETILTKDLGETSAPKFHYYADADLLIVTGTERAVEVTRKVISSLPGEENLSDKGGGVLGALLGRENFNNAANGSWDESMSNFKKEMESQHKAMEKMKKMLQQMQVPPQRSPP